MLENEVNNERSCILSVNIFLIIKIASKIVFARKKIHKKLTTRKVYAVFKILTLFFVDFLFNFVILSKTIIRPLKIPHKIYVKLAPCHKPLTKKQLIY